ncbi:superoxide dismutase [Segetibacter sp.]|jgi:Fe-Mn family superoxide dismutase|uniref:superoxide dismutase n=1 Tax=Segetibacter sp. TaxID=2231182 RepID=UPI002625A4CF|nr:superoxide dismutase [Segetibacter sp.]MCW3081595.1 superoxide dismutase [Segetibacter sp.]
MKKEQLSRRNFIEKSGKAGIALGLSATVLPSVFSCNPAHAMTKNLPPIPYTQQPLPYTYNALEPFIDATTMEIHYSKHAATYAKNLAEATVAEGVSSANTSLETLLGNISKYTPKMRNNAGGHYNHELFWKIMGPRQSAKPNKGLTSAITRDFGSYEAFTTQFSDAGKNRFGSGWAWLVITPDNKLKIGSTPNQDNPLMDVSDLKGMPLLGLDVWEHAYYLKYQNKRPDYITNWWNVVNWSFVSDRFDTAIK